MKAIVDPSGGGRDFGNVFSGVFEKDVTLKIANLTNLEKTRNGDIYLRPKDRIKKANNGQYDIFIRLKAEASQNKNKHGLIINSNRSHLAKKLKTALFFRFIFDVKTESEHTFFTDTDIASIEISVGYMSNKKDLRKIANNYFQKRLVQAIKKVTD